LKAGSSGPPPFDGNLAALFPGAYQVLQSDRGLQYGAVMRADAGNTSSVAFALTGATPAVPVPIWIRGVTGTTANIYYDGLGITPAMSGVAVMDSVNIVLTGAGAGMAITPGVGSLVPGNTWRATCSQLADQSGNGNPATQLTPAQQPIVALGLNGKVELIGDGVDDLLNSPAFLPPVGAMLYLVYRQLTSASFKYLTDGGGTGNRRAVFANFASTEAYNGLSLIGGTLPLNTYGRTWAIYNGAASSVKVGANPIASGDAGSNVSGPGRTIMCAGNETSHANMGLFALIWAPPGPTTIPDAALNSAGGYGIGAIAV
jgi:hypothetical protein